jgi:hypothetical protein
MRGHQVIEVEIEPHEFTDFCRAHRQGSNSQRMTDLGDREIPLANGAGLTSLRWRSRLPRARLMLSDEAVYRSSPILSRGKRR